MNSVYVNYLFNLLSSKNPKSSLASEQQVGKVEYTYGWYSAGARNNDVEDLISKVKP
jgi:hypothetical protein